MVNCLKTFPTLAPPTPTFQSNRFLAQHPRTSSFPRLKFSIFVSVYMSLYLHPPHPLLCSYLSLRRPRFPPNSIHYTLSSFPPHHVPTYVLVVVCRSTFANSRPMKARNFQRRETSSWRLARARYTSRLIIIGISTEIRERVCLNLQKSC